MSTIATALRPLTERFGVAAAVRRPVVSVGAAAVLVCVLHLPYLAAAPNDIDSINFALGVRKFDVSRHQPHPPGAPVYIAAGKVAAAAGAWLGLRADALAGIEPVALSVVASIGAALLTLALWLLFSALTPNRRRTALAVALAVGCPLAWLLAARPKSDVPGLAVATLAQALLLGRGRGRLVSGAALAGLASGIRIQAAILVLPLLVMRLTQEARREGPRVIGEAAAAAALVMLIWGTVLAFHGGGPVAYEGAVVNQAREDFAAETLTWSSASVRRVALIGAHVAILPWGAWPLAGFVLAFALAGAIVAVRARAWLELAMLALLWGPYAAFHFLVQDPLTVRYALPLVVPVAYLAAGGVAVLPRLGAVTASAAVLALTAVVSVVALEAQSHAGSQLFSLLGDIRARAAVTNDRAVLLSHAGPAAVGLERAEMLIGAAQPWRRIAPEPGREWLQIAQAWQSGGIDRMWFVADPIRTDLALIDPRARTLRGLYRSPRQSTWLVAGSRPATMDLYELTRPNWMALDGWSLTPETAGIASRDGKGPHLAPITAFLRTLLEPAVVVVGGRHLGAPASADARVTIKLDGVEIDSFVTSARDRAFLRFIAVNPRTGSDFARLTIASRAVDGSLVPIGIEQFDYQPTATIVFGYESGWHEPELNPATGLGWRWTSGRATLWMHAPRDVRVSIVGESPLRHFQRPAKLVVSAGATVIAERRLAGDYREEVCVPSGLLRASDGRLTLATDLTFVPGTRGSSPDGRVLGLRVYGVEVVADDCGSGQ